MNSSNLTLIFSLLDSLEPHERLKVKSYLEDLIATDEKTSQQLVEKLAKEMLEKEK